MNTSSFDQIKEEARYHSYIVKQYGTDVQLLRRELAG
jgi:hypothetical protein